MGLSNQTGGQGVIVADASVVTFLFLEGELSGIVRELYTTDPEWVTPPILNHEMLNILAAVGSAEGNVQGMEELWREARGVLGSRQQIPDPQRSLRLAIELGISGYQAQYLALADQLKLPLLTTDALLLDLLPKKTCRPEVYLEARRSGRPV
jgi:predicted nucleic acid-binding protein